MVAVVLMVVLMVVVMMVVMMVWWRDNSLETELGRVCTCPDVDSANGKALGSLASRLALTGRPCWQETGWRMEAASCSRYVRHAESQSFALYLYARGLQDGGRPGQRSRKDSSTSTPPENRRST